ncbi:MAG TPA: helix-turn-helix domain-containing protein [Bacteroidia bacterium]|nr:helix-turn-helix domain-containing protein [Bacteroidia bacterium]
MSKKTQTDCQSSILPIKDTLDVINGKWKILILVSIVHGNRRFKEIERSIPKINGKVLAKELKDLESHDLIKRTVYDEAPVVIEYTPTNYTESLEPVFDALRDWGLNHRKRIISKLKSKKKS